MSLMVVYLDERTMSLMMVYLDERTMSLMVLCLDERTMRFIVEFITKNETVAILQSASSLIFFKLNKIEIFCESIHRINKKKILHCFVIICFRTDSTRFTPLQSSAPVHPLIAIIYKITFSLRICS